MRTNTASIFTGTNYVTVSFTTMPGLQLTPLAVLRISSYQIPGHFFIPNTSMQHKPLLIYHSYFPSNTTASCIETHLETIGVVSPQWRYTMYSTTHFHSTTHEVLCIAQGRARLCKHTFAFCWETVLTKEVSEAKTTQKE
jgi:hypothetical protein